MKNLPHLQNQRAHIPTPTNTKYVTHQTKKMRKIFNSSNFLQTYCYAEKYNNTTMRNGIKIGTITTTNKTFLSLHHLHFISRERLCLRSRMRRKPRQSLHNDASVLNVPLVKCESQKVTISLGSTIFISSYSFCAVYASHHGFV